MTSSTTKTTPKSSEKEKSLYIRSTHSLWYVINTSEESEGKDKLTFFLMARIPRIFSDKKSPQGLCCVGWESVIYAFTGGSRDAKPEIFYLDTRCPDLGWKKGLAMSVKREVPVCAVLDGGIYVMGNPNIRSHLSIYDYYDYEGMNTTNTSVDGPWVEVFDPSLNESRVPYLGPTPNYSTCHHVRHAIAYGDMSLLVQFEGNDSLYCYHVDDDSWTLIDKKFDSQARNIIHNSLVVVEGILYCFDRRVLAYDLAKRRWFSEPVRGLNKEGVSPILYETNGWGSPDPNYPEAYLVHVGNGKLCLVWSAGDYDDTRMFVHCTKFRVYKDDDGGNNSILHAIIDSFGIYCTIHNCKTNISIAELLAI